MAPSLWLRLLRASGNSGLAGVTCNVGALKHSTLKPPLKHSSFKPLNQRTEREARRGIERWENEGGRLFPRVKSRSEGEKDWQDP